MNVELMSMNENASDTILDIWCFTKHLNREEAHNNEESKLFEEIMALDLPICESVNFVFKVQDVPRPFLDQAARHKFWTIWSQSYRVKNMRYFGQELDYYVPEGLNKIQEDLYDRSMLIAQDAYSGMIDLGASPEQARGLLPAHANISFVLMTSWRALKNALSHRSCFLLQQEYWTPFKKQITKIIEEKFGENISKLLDAKPCDKGECPYKKEVKNRLNGSDPNPPCPTYMEKYKAEIA